MWTYEQSTGKLSEDGKLVGTGYAGGNIPSNHNPKAVNNPAMQEIHCVGPLPRGLYTIGTAHNEPTLGPMAMYLQPSVGNTMFGRSGFFMHADSISHPGQASEGCIVMPLNVRQQVATSSDRRLQVIE